MTRKEKELKALEAFDLKIGDRIKGNEPVNPFFKIVEDDTSIRVINEETGVEYNAVYYITFYDWEKAETPLRDKKCKDFNCTGCPIYKAKQIECLIVKDISDITIGEVYNEIKEEVDEVGKELYGEE